MRRTMALVLACIMIVLCLAGCGSSGSTASTATAAPAAAASGTTAAAGDTAVEDGTLRIAESVDFQTMDVMQTTKDYFIPINIFDRLFEIKLKDDGSTEIVNSLCDSYTVSDDGLTYDFKLKQGIKFSNGSDLTAGDVEYTFLRLLDPSSVNSDIPLEVVGAEDVQAGTAKTLSGFAVKGDYEFTITLSDPNAGFIAELTAPAVSIVDKETTEAAKNFGSDITETVGTGPYTVTEWVTNDHITLEYNKNYWGDEPSVKKCIIYIVPDPSTLNLMYQNGQLDVIDLDRLDSSIVSSTYQTNYANNIIKANRVALSYLTFNEKDKYLSDANVRKAIQMAIDRQSILDSVYGGNGKLENGIIPTGVVGHNDSAAEIKYDPDAAKALLEKAGYKDGDITLELSYDNSSDSNKQMVYQVVQQNLQAIGITANIVSYDESSWLALRKSGDMCMYINTWTMDYNDPANIMFTFFGNTDKTTLRSLNYPNADIMDRVASASSIMKDDERYAEYQALEKQIVTEDAAWLPLYETQHLFAVSDRVSKYTPHWAGYSDFYVNQTTLK